MSFIKEFSELIKNNCEAYRMIEAARMDDIKKDTMFIVASTEINNGMMCGGDGTIVGEWAWANDINDYIDYITNLAIPFDLCAIEEQDPQIVLDDTDNSFIFDYNYQEKHLPIRDELKRLYYALKEIRNNNPTFEAVKKELYKTNKQMEKLNGELIFRFYFFKDLNSALKAVQDSVLFEDLKSAFQEIIELKELTEKDSNILCKYFVNNALEGEPRYLDDKDYVLLEHGKNNPWYVEEGSISNVMFEYKEDLQNDDNMLTTEEAMQDTVNYLEKTGRIVYNLNDLSNLDGLLTEFEKIKDERQKEFSKGKYDNVYDYNFYDNTNFQTYFVAIKKADLLSQLSDKTMEKFTELLQDGKKLGIHFLLGFNKDSNKEFKEKMRKHCSCGIFTK